MLQQKMEEGKLLLQMLLMEEEEPPQLTSCCSSSRAGEGEWHDVQILSVPQLSTADADSGRSSEEISKELSRGVTLDGGSVEDATSRAEKALTAAQEKYEALLDDTMDTEGTAAAFRSTTSSATA